MSIITIGALSYPVLNAASRLVYPPQVFVFWKLPASYQVTVSDRVETKKTVSEGMSVWSHAFFRILTRTLSSLLLSKPAIEPEPSICMLTLWAYTDDACANNRPNMITKYATALSLSIPIERITVQHCVIFFSHQDIYTMPKTCWCSHWC